MSPKEKEELNEWKILVYCNSYILLDIILMNTNKGEEGEARFYAIHFLLPQRLMLLCNLKYLLLRYLFLFEKCKAFLLFCFVQAIYIYINK